jgi:hypothetical protein
MTKHQFIQRIASLFCVLCAGIASAQTDVNISVGGVIQPGVYGRVEIGTRPPPAVIYPQPIIITQPPVVVAQPVVVSRAPVYLHVPPGHAKKWSKHCYKYNACAQPVYFVKNDYSEYNKQHGNGHGNGKGHGHGKNKNKH